MLRWVTRSLAFGLGALVGAHLGTRFALRSVHAPTPPQMSFLLDNPIRRIYLDPARTIDFAGIHRNAYVLDAGCGSGIHVMEAANRVGPNGRVYALDIQAAMINITARRVEAEQAHNVFMLLAPLERIPLPANSIDCALMISALSEVKERSVVLAEARRVLKPGGALVVGEDVFAPTYSRPTTTRSWLESAGFKLTGWTGNGLAYLLRFVKPVSAAHIAFGR
ncbi:MAG: methyltransferase domain-containing protein [Anaerolineae bacterium]|nr:methyltransferase domain-containing protein [Thermoflexales bacterium]MDW8408426.1 methyltransferase domain-containing protein [Anaerolineae bacterium]